jgi:hypothetical protein
MSQLEVDKIIPQSGTTLTIGDSGDTVNFADGTSIGIDTNTLYIDSTNNRVGIGTASPGVKLDLVDNTGSLSATNDITAQFTRADGTYNPKLRIRHSTTGSDISHSYSTTADNLTFSIGNSEAIRIHPDGKVGFGASSQAQQVAIVVDNSSTVITNGTQNLELSNINGTNGTYSRILFNDNPGGAGAGVIGFKLTDTTSNYGQFEFWTSGSSGSGTRMVIEPNGNVGIGTSSPSQKLDVVGSIEVSDGIYIGGTGSANKLDDYEEGTWTPTMTASGSGAITLTSTEGIYTKIGNLVYLWGIIDADLTSKSGTYTFGGAPFNAEDVGDHNFRYSGVTSYQNNTGVTTPLLIQFSTATVISIYKNTSAGAFTSSDTTSANFSVRFALAYRTTS